MSKNIIKPFKLFSAVALTANQTSKITDISRLDNVGILISWGGTSPVGTVFVDVASYNENEATNWQPLDFGATIAISGNSGTHQININQNPFTQLRLRYVFASGTGTMDAVITAKQLGGV